MKKRLFPLCLAFCVFCADSLAFASENDFVENKSGLQAEEYKGSVKDFILPVGLLSVGIIASATNHKDIFSFKRSDYKGGNSSWEYVLLGGVAGSMFVFDSFIEAEHKPIDRSLLLVCSAGLSLVPAYLIKENYESYRPDGEPHSFPSGHATTGFMIAHVLNKEFRKSNPWVAYGGYVVASAVSVYRVAINKHRVCDILAGAGLGILGTELAYLFYFPIRNKTVETYKRKRDKTVSFYPVVSPETLGLNLNIRF